MFLLIARWVPVTGFIFGVLVIVASILESGVPDKHASDSAWTSYYADTGNRRKEEIAFLLIGLAGLCFLQFLGSLRGALARAEGEPARITTAAIASGAAFITLAVGAHAISSSYSWGSSYFGSSLTVDPDTARLLGSVSYVFFGMSLFFAASMALAVATLAFWMRALPMWLAILSGLSVIGGLLGMLGIPSLVVLAWIMLLSLYLVWPKREPQPAPPPP